MAFELGNMVLYKNKTARVLSVADKLEIEILGGGNEKVRPKDIVFLHKGPIKDWGVLQTSPKQMTHGTDGELEEIWQMLEGEHTDVAWIAEMLYGSSSPADVYAAWQKVQSTPFFKGMPDALEPQTPESIDKIRRAEQEKQGSEQRWYAMLERLRNNTFVPEDKTALLEVENVALGKSDRSKILGNLGKSETPEVAHATLMRIGFWDEQKNPHPSRTGAILNITTLELPDFPEEERLDLTHLQAFAIDDEGSSDPDDAISLEAMMDGTFKLWVHVSDVAALVPADSELDLEARRRGSTLYLPEKIIPMLPEAAVQRLGLGLEEVSKALSFEITLENETPHAELPQWVPVQVDVHPSSVRVTRTTYAAVSEQLEHEPFKTLYGIALSLERGRVAEGAVQLKLPEAKIKVEAGVVKIKSIGEELARPIVQESMMLAGWAAAQFAVDNDITIPFAAQELNERWLDPSSKDRHSASMAVQFAKRKTLGRTQWKPQPARHAGLGLEQYAQTTSPMRRYLDLVVHQQIRAFLANQEELPIREVLTRMGAADLASSAVREAERKSLKHWTLVYLMQHPDWQGEGVVVDSRGTFCTLIIPELAFETQIAGSYPLDQVLRLEVASIDLASLEMRARVLV